MVPVVSRIPASPALSALFPRYRSSPIRYMYSSRVNGAATVIAPGLVGNTSVNVALFIGAGLGLVRSKVNVLVPPLAMLAGENDLVIIGTAVTVTLSDAGFALVPAVVTRSPAAIVLV